MVANGGFSQLYGDDIVVDKGNKADGMHLYLVVIAL